MAAIKRGDAVCYAAVAKVERMAEGLAREASVVENGVIQDVLQNTVQEARLLAERLETFRRGEYGQPTGPDETQ